MKPIFIIYTRQSTANSSSSYRNIIMYLLKKWKELNDCYKLVLINPSVISGMTGKAGHPCYNITDLIMVSQVLVY